MKLEERRQRKKILSKGNDMRGNDLGKVHIHSSNDEFPLVFARPSPLQLLDRCPTFPQAAPVTMCAPPPEV